MRDIGTLEDGREYRFGLLQVDIVGHTKLFGKNPDKKIQNTRKNLRTYVEKLAERNLGCRLSYGGDGGIIFFAVKDLEKDFDLVVQTAIDCLGMLETFNKNKTDGNLLGEDIHLRVSGHTCMLVYGQDFADTCGIELNKFMKYERDYGQVDGIGITGELFKNINSNGLKRKFIPKGEDLYIYTDHQTGEIGKVAKQSTGDILPHLSPDSTAQLLVIFQDKTRELDHASGEKELEQIIQFRNRIFDEIFAPLDNKIINTPLLGEKFPFVLFDRIVFKPKLDTMDTADIRNFLGTGGRERYQWYDRCLIVSGLTVSLINRFDPQKVELLIDFLMEFEEKVWQRALIGILLGLKRHDQTLQSHEPILKRLAKLQDIQDVQEGIIKITLFLAKGEYDKPLFDFQKHSFFEKPAFWFYPFYSENKNAVESLEKVDHNINKKQFLSLLHNCFSLMDSEKYITCFSMQTLSSRQVEELIIIFKRESEEIESLYKYKNKKRLHLNEYSNYLNVVHSFYKNFPQQKFINIFEEKVELYSTSLLDMLLKEAEHTRLQAEIKFQNEHYPEALELYTKYLENNPRDHKAWNNMGLAYRKLGKYEKAIEAYQKAVESKPDFHEAWYNMGIAYEKLEKHEQAIEAYQKAVEIKPDFHEAWENMGFTYGKSGKYKEQIEAYEKALAIKPDSTYALNGLAWVLATNKERKYRDGKKALEYARKAYNLKSDWFQLDTLAAAYAETGDFEQAVKTQREAIRLLEDKSQLEEFEAHLKLYEQGLPCRE